MFQYFFLNLKPHDTQSSNIFQASKYFTGYYKQKQAHLNAKNTFQVLSLMSIRLKTGSGNKKI